MSTLAGSGTQQSSTVIPTGLPTSYVIAGSNGPTSNSNTALSTAATYHYKLLYTASSSTNVTNCSIIDDGTDVTWIERKSLDVEGDVVLIPAEAQKYRLPDGAILHVDDQGNYKLDDAAAKVVYHASRMREFNPYVNASDLLARFIEDAGQLGLRQGEVPTLPLALFVHWLILEAAQADGDPVPPDVVPITQHHLLRSRIRPRCQACKRFVRRDLARHNFPYCNDVCAERWHRRCA